MDAKGRWTEPDTLGKALVDCFQGGNQLLKVLENKHDCPIDQVIFRHARHTVPSVGYPYSCQPVTFGLYSIVTKSTTRSRYIELNIYKCQELTLQAKVPQKPSVTSRQHVTLTHHEVIQAEIRNRHRVLGNILPTYPTYMWLSRPCVVHLTINYYYYYYYYYFKQRFFRLSPLQKNTCATEITYWKQEPHVCFFIILLSSY